MTDELKEALAKAHDFLEKMRNVTNPQLDADLITQYRSRALNTLLAAVEDAIKDPGVDEQSYVQGYRAAWVSLLQEALGNLGDEDRDRHAWRLEREQAIAALRGLCEEFGDNDWSENLHLADIIRKHLENYLMAPKEEDGEEKPIPKNVEPPTKVGWYKVKYKDLHVYDLVRVSEAKAHNNRLMVDEFNQKGLYIDSMWLEDFAKNVEWWEWSDPIELLKESSLDEDVLEETGY